MDQATDGSIQPCTPPIFHNLCWQTLPNECHRMADPSNADDDACSMSAEYMANRETHNFGAVMCTAGGGA